MLFMSHQVHTGFLELPCSSFEKLTLGPHDKPPLSQAMGAQNNDADDEGNQEEEGNEEGNEGNQEEGHEEGNEEEGTEEEGNEESDNDADEEAEEPDTPLWVQAPFHAR